MTHLTEVADGLLRDLGHQVKIVRDSDYDIKEEVQNFAVWADVMVIWQMRMVDWAPWTVKIYG